MKNLILLLMLSVPSWAAIASATAWEVRTTGTATSGAGYSTGGTDMSQFDNKNATSCTSCQSATVNISTTDAVTANTTTVTSATANFSSALIGNTIYLSGTGTTTGWYQVTAVGSALSITVDRATGSTGGTGVTMNIGGAVASIPAITAAVAAGNMIYVKASATYTTAASYTFTVSGSSGIPVTWIGYTSTRTDGGKATIQASGGSINIFTGSATFQRFRNFILDCNSHVTCGGFNESGADVVILNVKAMGFTIKGINMVAGQYAHNIWATGGTTGCTAGISLTGGIVDSSASSGNICPGVLDGGTSTSTSGTYIRVISANNTGATTDGFQKTGAGGGIFYGCIAYANGRDGFRFTTGTSLDSLSLRNSTAILNTGIGFDSTTTDWSSSNVNLDFNFNGYFGNTGGNLFQMAAGGGDPAMSGDPYVSGSTGNFALNNTSGAGAALRAAGFPGTLQYGGTGFLDIGALQHQDTGGSGATVGYPIQ